MTDHDVRPQVLARCHSAIPAWQDSTIDDFEFDDPKGFSSFTIGVRARHDVEPSAVLYRQLEGKQNAILDFDTERRVFILLGEAGIAAECLHYDETCRIEAFYRGRTLTAEDVFDPAMQKGVAAELWRLHHLQPQGLPERTFFELLADKWGDLAREVSRERATPSRPTRPKCAPISKPSGARTLAARSFGVSRTASRCSATTTPITATCSCSTTGP